MAVQQQEGLHVVAILRCAFTAFKDPVLRLLVVLLAGQWLSSRELRFDPGVFVRFRLAVLCAATYLFDCLFVCLSQHGLLF